METFDYPFEEFEKHYDDLYEGDQFVEGDFVRNMLTIRRYMEAKYGEGPEASYKAMRFGWIVIHVTFHIEDFNKGNYGVTGSDESGSLVSKYILKAVHELFTSQFRSLEPSTEEIMRLADKYKLEDESEEKHYDLGDDPRTAKLVKLLGERFPDLRNIRAGARGIVLLVLRWTAANAPNGDLSSYSPEVIARAVDWEGDPKALVGLLVDAGFLDEKQRFIDIEKMHADYQKFFGWAFGDE